MPGEVKDGAAGGMARSAGIVSAFTALSRLLGLVREQVFAALLGASREAEAFLVAFRVPNLLRDLFAEGALSAAFVPTYARALAEGGPERGHRLASRVLTLLAASLGFLVLVGLLLAEPLVRTLAPGFERVAGKLELTVLLTRIMLPFLPVVSFGALTMAMLNVHGRFGTPAAAPALFNVVAIAWAAGLWALGLSPEAVAVGWAVGTLLGGIAQFLIQVPPLWRSGWRPRLEWAPSDPGIRDILHLMGPATLGLAAVEVNILVSTFFASHEPRAVAWLQYAFRVLYVPIGVFGVAVGTVAGAGLARRAAAGDLDGLRSTLGQALRMLAFVTLPATAGLMVLSGPIVRLLYERGRFLPSDTAATAVALSIYSIGLVAYTAVKVLAPAFYALGRPRLALLGSAAAVATNVAVILALHGRLGFRAIALGTALGSVANATILAGAFEAKVGGLLERLFSKPVALMAAATLLMAAACRVAAAALESRVGTAGLTAQLVTGLLPVVLGAGLYALVALVFGIPEARRLVSAVLRRGTR